MNPQLLRSFLLTPLERAGQARLGESLGTVDLFNPQGPVPNPAAADAEQVTWLKTTDGE